MKHTTKWSISSNPVYGAGSCLLAGTLPASRGSGTASPALQEGMPDTVEDHHGSGDRVLVFGRLDSEQGTAVKCLGEGGASAGNRHVDVGDSLAVLTGV
ncbi:hypothetical protein [Streptomyces profundus]|uniref:hypothetical protein n=1 Tax=Streptomyces profundus TaxID=2867410 RepID=UPI001D165626|nr:hypothetical protein [Streptomyces sp. MA3_2.13]UED84773.1 hypothetical protein K4G22_11620 [Streptomyces sp. MA3_2.13]